MLRRSKVILKSTTNRPDLLLFGLILGLTIFGVIMVANTSVVEAYRDFGDKFYYFRLQIRWAVIGILAFFVGLNFPYRNLKKISLPLLILSITLLVAVLVPGVGIEALGAKRRLGLAGFYFQPAELAKFSFIIWLSAFLSIKKRLWPFLLILVMLVGLIMLEPDLGTTVVLVASSLAIYFSSQAPLWQIGLAGLIGILGGTGLIFSSAYRKERLLTFLNPTHDPLGTSYHVRQVLIALGSGGLFGLGLGQSRQKYEYLPEVTTDSIFAVIAEELGFIGASLLILAFLLVIWRGLKIAKQAPDTFGKLLAIGITSWIGFQALTNFSAMVALIPLTGIPLPFISYGGSSLVLTLLASGILLNISRYKVVKK